jgi:hypothetical protein
VSAVPEQKRRRMTGDRLRRRREMQVSLVVIV